MKLSRERIRLSTSLFGRVKTKLKRRALINNIEEGGLRMIHLESIIQEQKIPFLYRYSDPDGDADWKIVLNFFLQPVGAHIS